MGTSQSTPGPGGNSPLVPPWADGAPKAPPPEPQRFKPFRTKMGQFLKSGNTSDLRGSLKHYAGKGSGGGGTASARMGSITGAGSSLFAALSGSDGTATKSDQSPINIGDYAGQPCDVFIEEVTLALSSGDGDSEKIQSAMNHALVEALDGVEVFDPSVITDDVIVDTMLAYLSESIFLQVVMDAGKAWTKSETQQQNQKAETALRQLIRAEVDNKMAPKVATGVKSMSSNTMLDIQQSVITEVWQEWESYDD